MIDFLIAVVLTGLAVTFVIELLDLSIVGDFFGRQVLNVFFALPLSFGGMVLLQPLDLRLVVLVPAATFVSLILGKMLSKPQLVGGTRLPRL